MFIPNTTCDYFEAGKVVGVDVPDIAGLVCHLDGDFKNGNAGTDKLRWTHLLLIDLNALVIYTGSAETYSRVYIPDESGTEFEVIFVEVLNRRTANAYKRVYLERKAVLWPTEEL